MTKENSSKDNPDADVFDQLFAKYIQQVAKAHRLPKSVQNQLKSLSKQRRF